MKRPLLNPGLLALLLAAGICGNAAADGVLAKSTVLEGNVAYLRLSQIGNNLPGDISSALDGLTATNKIAGIVLDLRFSGGADPGNLTSTERVLERPRLPLAILMNDQTTGAATKLAEDLRESDAGLVFGASPDKFRPDIGVSVGTNEEESFLKSPYGIMTDSNNVANADTNLLPYADIDHTTEADLVREKIKNGDENPNGADPGLADTQPRPFIRDPALARGLDFIKGLAALHAGNH